MASSLSVAVANLSTRSSLDFFRDDWAVIADQIPASDRKLDVEKTIRATSFAKGRRELNSLHRVLCGELLRLSIWLEGWEAAKAGDQSSGHGSERKRRDNGWNDGGEDERRLGMGVRVLGAEERH